MVKVKLSRANMGGYLISVPNAQMITGKVITEPEVTKLDFLSNNDIKKFLNAMDKAGEYGEAEFIITSIDKPNELVIQLDRVLEKKENDMDNILEIKEEVQIQQKDKVITLEKGDKIKVLKEELLTNEILADKIANYVVNELQNSMGFDEEELFDAGEAFGEELYGLLGPKNSYILGMYQGLK